VIDVRNIGLVGGIELASREGAPGARGFETYLKCFERGVLVRNTGDILALAPALIVEDSQIDEIVSTIGAVLKDLA
jgi:beta-alanine--pyruvate transaminase